MLDKLDKTVKKEEEILEEQLQSGEISNQEYCQIEKNLKKFNRGKYEKT
jgi:uncharacterized membrane protein